MSKPSRFLVKNIEDFVNKTRAVTFNMFGSENTLELDINTSDQAELDRILPYNESLLIVKQHLIKEYNKKKKKYRYVITDNTFMTIINDLNKRMISNILTSLVNKGLVEMAFDDNTNDFIFWVKNNDKTDKTESN